MDRAALLGKKKESSGTLPASVLMFFGFLVFLFELIKAWVSFLHVRSGEKEL